MLNFGGPHLFTTRRWVKSERKSNVQNLPRAYDIIILKYVATRFNLPPRSVCHSHHRLHIRKFKIKCSLPYCVPVGMFVIFALSYSSICRSNASTFVKVVGKFSCIYQKIFFIFSAPKKDSSFTRI